jgi:hypothetical protein
MPGSTSKDVDAQSEDLNMQGLFQRLSRVLPSCGEALGIHLEVGHQICDSLTILQGAEVAAV